MPPRDPRHRSISSRARASVLLCLSGLAAAVALGACSSSTPVLSAATVPHWQPQYRDLPSRLRRLGLPAGDSERFHIHALLTIYDHGYLVRVPANVGLDKAHDVESTLHTHDRTGIIHMEGPRPFPYTLGDFFAVWGVRFGAGRLGTMHDDGPDRVWVYVNGKRIAHPSGHVLAKDDNIVIGYGTSRSFPHRVSGYMLKQVESGGKALACSVSPKASEKSSCTAPKRRRRSV